MFAYADPKHPCPPSRRTFNPDGSRIQPLTAQQQADEDAYWDRMRARFGDKVRPAPSYYQRHGEAEVVVGSDDEENDSVKGSGEKGLVQEGEHGERAEERKGEGRKEEGEGERGHGGQEKHHRGPIRKVGRAIWDSFDEHKRGAKWGSYAWENR